MKNAPDNGLLTITQWELWETIKERWWDARLDAARELIFVPRYMPDLVLHSINFHPSYRFLEYTQTVFEPGTSIHIGVPYLTRGERVS